MHRVDTTMNIWRLMANHIPEHYNKVVSWSRSNNVVAVGWGGTDDLNKHSIADELSMVSLVGNTHSTSGQNHANGGRSLWNLYHEVRNGDLIIINAPRPSAVMRVIGEYHYVPDESPPFYEHRLKAEPVPINAKLLWSMSGGIAPGQGPFPTIVRCANTISDAEYEKLLT